MPYYLIDLEGARATVAPVVLRDLPPEAKCFQGNPAENHDQHGQSDKEEPMKASPASWPSSAGFLCAGYSHVFLVDIHVRRWSGLERGHTPLASRATRRDSIPPARPVPVAPLAPLDLPLLQPLLTPGP